MSGQNSPARSDSLRPLLAGVVVLVAILLGTASLKSYRDLSAERMREQLLERRIEEAQSGIERLRGHIERLRGDSATLERIAREDLGMVRPRDVVIELPREEPAMASPPPPGSAAPAAPLVRPR